MDLRDRSLIFSKEIIRFSKSLERNQITMPITDQLIRSATSIGANFTEAKDSASKKDFRSKVLISKKEASETLYWLKLCEELTNDRKINDLQRECLEIILILQKIITTLAN
jgi:four helix bundle protein